MKFKFNSKYNTIAVYVILVFAVCIFIIAAVMRYDEFSTNIQSIIKVFSPIIWGLIIAYLLNPIMVRLDKFLKPIINKKKEHKSTVRVVSVTITSIFTIACFSGVIAMVMPEILNSLNILIDNTPTYFNNFYDKAIEFLDNNPEISSTIKSWLEEQFSTVQSSVVGWITNLKPTIDGLVNALKNGISSVIVGIKDFILGFIVSIYLLFNKEDFIAQSKKVMYALFSKKRCDKLLNIGRDANDKFIGFISGKAIDSFIIGMLAFVVLTIMKMPYTVLVSCIIGITNMIPFFGPIIGAVPSAFLILLYNPAKVIPFIIFIIILQQIDGNIIGPKILGNSIGLPTFWIIFAIFIGGGLFGFIGMLIGVPAFAVIYTLFKTAVDEKLVQKNLSTDIDEYRSPVTEQPPEPSETKTNKTKINVLDKLSHLKKKSSEPDKTDEKSDDTENKE